MNDEEQALSEKVDLIVPVFISTYREGLSMAGPVCIFWNSFALCKEIRCFETEIF